MVEIAKFEKRPPFYDFCCLAYCINSANERTKLNKTNPVGFISLVKQWNFKGGKVIFIEQN